MVVTRVGRGGADDRERGLGAAGEQRSVFEPAPLKGGNVGATAEDGFAKSGSGRKRERGVARDGLGGGLRLEKRLVEEKTVVPTDGRRGGAEIEGGEADRIECGLVNVRNGVGVELNGTGMAGVVTCGINAEIYVSG